MSKKLIRPCLAGLALLCSSTVIAKSAAVDPGFYTTKDKEFYLTADEIFFIRPGLDLKIIEFTIPSDRTPVVTYTVKDPGGLNLDPDGVTTPGPISIRHMLTYVGADGQKHKYYSGTRDSDGTTTDLGDGKFKYRFGTVLPSGYDRDATHTYTLAGRRDLREWDLGRYSDNEQFHMVPSGASDPMPREIVTIETCNGRCHDPLAMHGGTYIDTQTCTQCHNPSIGDEARFDVLIHEVHLDAHSYPTDINDCQVCHTGGTPTANFPLAADPNPVPVCDASGLGVTTLSWDFPANYEIRIGSVDGTLWARTEGAGSKATGKWVRNGTDFFVVNPATGKAVQRLGVDTTTFGCQGNAPFSARGEPGLMHSNWLDHPSRLVCGSCHTDVDFETGEGHSEYDFPLSDDNLCAACHVPYSGKEFDRSIMGAHKVPEASSQLPGLIVEIVEVKNTDPGDFPTVVFNVRNKFGKVDPNTLNRLTLVIAGPNEDYSFRASETASGKSVVMGNHWAYTFTTPLPANAKGSFTASMEGRNSITLDVHGSDEEIRDPVQATLFPFAVTGDLKARREVVDDYNCESCHVNLALHGGGRTNATYCTTCHLPDLVDIDNPAESVHFKWMIHKIHRGEKLDNGYVVVRSRGTYDFSEIEFPGDLRNCEKCHNDDTYQIPLPEGVLPTSTPAEFLLDTPPISATCLGCHDSDDAKTHAYAQTTIFGESCGACHGRNASFSIDKIHAR